MSKKKKIGVIGYGHLGQFLVERILAHENLDLGFVWNRSVDKIGSEVPKEVILPSLEDFKSREVDLVVEVSHPVITKEWGAKILQHADYLVGSPTALADREVEGSILSSATSHACYVPSGAFWGGDDIRRMADAGTLQALKVTMAKHPSCFRLESPLKEVNHSVTERTVLYEGSVRGLCPLAPNNVNTMAAAAIAGHNLGLDGVQCCLVSDPGLPDFHLVEVDVWGPGDISSGRAFHVNSRRMNPAAPGAVTGSATYMSLMNSILRAHSQTSGVHLC